MRIKGKDYQPFLSIFFFFFGFGRHIGFWEAAGATRPAASFSKRACLSREKKHSYIINLDAVFSIFRY